ncbi:short-chain dehydrogenase [Xylariomycetidae sp. FL0641]|nr:short-chain dehydrogenase [Xylariomycetidae sp. FL0641]
MTDANFPLTGRYADLHRFSVVAGPGDARPTGAQIVADEGLEGALPDKVFLVTGCTTPQGAGAATVRALLRTGATVFGTGLDVGGEARATLADELATGRLHLLPLDQASMASVRACAEEVKRRTDRLHVLVANAGVMNLPEQRTPAEGLELHFAVNHASHWLLARLLTPLLLASATPARAARAVFVASVGHRTCAGGLDWDNLFLEGGYDGGAAYGQSKLANIWTANHLDRLYGDRGLHAVALQPGGWVSPHLQRYSAGMVEWAQRDPLASRLLLSPEQACATSVYAAVSRELEGKGAVYLEGCGIAGPAPEGANFLDYGYGANAFSPEDEERLWEVTKKLVGVE